MSFACFLGDQRWFFGAYMPLGYVGFLMVRIFPSESCDCAAIDDDLGQKCGHWRARPCASYHQQAQVAQTTYENSRGDQVRE